MDPDRTLDDLRTLAAEVDDPTISRDYLAAAMAERIAALDAWLNRGGHLPLRWHTAARFAFTPKNGETR